MRVLITGGSSLLGKYLLQSAPDEHEVTATWYTNYVGQPMLQLDVCNPSQVEYIFGRVKPEVVIHCAGVGDVDYAQDHYQEVQDINVNGTANITKACRDAGALLIYPSTNAVFDGGSPPYKEDDPRRPINVYGAVRQRAEDKVMQGCHHWIIPRLFLLYGWPWSNGRTNWSIRARRFLEQGKTLRMVNDNYWQPTHAGDAARAIWRLIELGAEGICHVAGHERVSLYEFVKALALVWGHDAELVQAVPASEYASMAPRPVDSTYDLSKAHELGVCCLGVMEGLDKMKEEDPEEVK